MRSRCINNRTFSNLKFYEKDYEVTNELCYTVFSVLSLPMRPYMSNEKNRGYY